jgi:MOSC domain-containing protein YiiM
MRSRPKPICACWPARLDSTTLGIGDRLRVGEILLEIMAPRIPCVTIAARMDDPQFVQKFRYAEKPGVYCRVIATGYVAVNDPVALLPYQGPAVSVLELFRAGAASLSAGRCRGRAAPLPAGPSAGRPARVRGGVAARDRD